MFLSAPLLYISTSAWTSGGSDTITLFTSFPFLLSCSMHMATFRNGLSAPSANWSSPLVT